MRVPRTPEASDPPPPPYTPSASDILTPPPSETAEPPEQPLRPAADVDARAITNPSNRSVDSIDAPSAFEYFSTRPFTRGETLQNEGVILNFLTRPITFIPSTRRDEIAYPEPVETFFNRDVTYKDWNLFKSHLLAQNAASFENEKATFELTPSQQEHVKSVLADWNKGFFRPRRIGIQAVFDASQQSASTDVPDSNATARRLRRSGSMSSIASSASNVSSASSISSIDPNDIESVPPATIRDLLTSIRSDPTAKQDLRTYLQDLRGAFHSQAESLCTEERKELRKNFKREHRELGREIRKIVREARQEQREERKALRRAQRETRRASRQKTITLQGERSCPFTQPRVNSTTPNGHGLGATRSQARTPFGAEPPSLASSSRAPTTASEQQKKKGLLGSAVDTMNQWAKACEDACDLGEKHAVEVAKKLDVMIEEGERKLKGTSF